MYSFITVVLEYLDLLEQLFFVQFLNAISAVNEVSEVTAFEGSKFIRCKVTYRNGVIFRGNNQNIFSLIIFYRLTLDSCK